MENGTDPLLYKGMETCFIQIKSCNNSIDSTTCFEQGCMEDHDVINCNDCIMLKDC